jgi:hypothetical protein
VRKLSWDQMTLVFATQFAGEIAAVMHGEGDAVLPAAAAASRTFQPSSSTRWHNNKRLRAGTTISVQIHPVTSLEPSCL